MAKIPLTGGQEKALWSFALSRVMLGDPVATETLVDAYQQNYGAKTDPTVIREEIASLVDLELVQRCDGDDEAYAITEAGMVWLPI